MNISIFILMSYHPIIIKKGVISGKKIRYYLGTFPKCWNPPPPVTFGLAWVRFGYFSLGLVRLRKVRLG